MNYEDQERARYDVLLGRIVDIAEGNRMAFYPDDVRTKRVTVTRVEIGIGRTFWEDDGGSRLVPSGYVRADEVSDLVFAVKEENQSLRVELKDREGRIGGLTGQLLRMEEKLELARKPKRRRKKVDPMKRVR